MIDPDNLMSLDNRHAFSMPWWARPGLSTFAKKAEGGGGDDEDEQDDDEDEEDDDEDDEEEDDLADLSEDELKEELRKTRESLSKASGSSKKKRDTIKSLRAELAKRPAVPSKKKAKDDEDDDAPDADEAREQGRSEATTAANLKIKRTAVRGELKAAGVPAERLSRAVGLIDLDELDVDEDGNVDGLEEALDDLRDNWAELFPKTRTRRTRTAGEGDRDGREDKRGGKTKLSNDELQARVLLGKAQRSRR